MDEQFDVTVIIATYNRADMLPEAVESVLAQDAFGVRYEVIVVDNNSPDQTREVVESIIARGDAPNLRYLFEGKQGVAHARNTALAHARAPIIAFTDDDVRVAPDWVATIKRSLDEHPEVDCVGGKVLPRWREEPPDWLTPKHWSPLALSDYGETPIYTNTERPICLVTANLAFRREVFDRIGLFEPACQRVKDGIGSTEDHELQMRFWNTGGQGLYDPRLRVEADVQPERMDKAYHRRWHTGHGRFCSMMRMKDFEVARAHLFGVSSYLYKQAITDGLTWLKFTLYGNRRMAFRTEIKLRFFMGFYRQRRSEYLNGKQHGVVREFLTFARSLAAGKKVPSSKFQIPS
ncbi:MAG: glycosyltransferase family 2 protein [Pyrinomonadaceae bacterium]